MLKCIYDRSEVIMKKYFVFLVIFVTFFISTQFLKADCESAIKEAENIKVSKIVRIPDSMPGEGNDNDFLIGVSIENMSNDFYAVVTNNYNSEEVTVKAEDMVDGVALVSTPYIYKSVKMNVKIYSNNSDKCSSTDALIGVDVDSGVFNKYYYTWICQENRDLELCEPTKETDDIKETDFKEQIEKKIEEKNKNLIDRLLDFLKKYYLFIICPILIISFVYIVRIIILKRRLNCT